MKDLDEESERWRAALSAPEYERSAPQACPRSQDIFDAVSGLAGPGLRRRIIAHIAGCPNCAEEWRCAMRLLSGVESEFEACEELE